MTDSELLQRLMQALNFTAEDLALNRNGLASARQVQSLRRSAWISSTRIAALAVLLAIVMLAGSLRVSDRSVGAALQIASAASAPVILALAWFNLRRGLAEAASLEGTAANEQARVLAVEGEGQLGSAGNRYGHYWYIKVGGVHFEIPFPATFILINGLAYRVYFTPASKRLLSLEPTPAQVP